MSIAVSTVIHPSRRLQMATYGMCAAILAQGGVIALGGVDSFSVCGRVLVVLGSLAAVLTALVVHDRQQTAWRMTVSAQGIIRLKQEEPRCHADRESTICRLLPDSTLWPDLMLLRLQSEAGQTFVLRILQDSLSRDDYRALSVALRWLAAHGGRPDGDSASAGAG